MNRDDEVPVVISTDLDSRGNSPADVPLPGSWRCECGDLNRDDEAFCFRCGDGQPDDEDEPARTAQRVVPSITKPGSAFMRAMGGGW